MFAKRSKIQDIKKSVVKNFIEYFSYSKTRMEKCVSTKDFFFDDFKILGYSRDKTIGCIVNHLS